MSVCAACSMLLISMRGWKQSSESRFLKFKSAPKPFDLWLLWQTPNPGRSVQLKSTSFSHPIQTSGPNWQAASLKAVIQGPRLLPLLSPPSSTCGHQLTELNSSTLTEQKTRVPSLLAIHMVHTYKCYLSSLPTSQGLKFSPIAYLTVWGSGKKAVCPERGGNGPGNHLTPPSRRLF